jgi:hypothetical protein
MAGRDRRAQVLASSTTNGIDFVEIANTTQTELRVHFLNAVNVEGTIGTPTITGGETIPTVAVLPVSAPDWGWDDGHAVVTLFVAAPGDFSLYTLTIPSPVLDRFFNHVQFSFKAGCPSDLDCQMPAAVCPPPVGNPPPIDYLAKDFLSFRQALLDFSTLRYASWQERSEADFGVMFLEALSAIADELSYTQDRIATEATLLTATERRSVMRHARLVDYEPMPPVSAGTWLQFEVVEGTTSIQHRLAATAPGAGGTPIAFETGLGLRDTSTFPPASYLWNRYAAVPIAAYWFDDSEQCLTAGATHMHVAGHGYGFVPGQMLLIETQPANPADPVLRQIVHLVQLGDPNGPPAVEICDELFTSPVTSAGPPYMTCAASPPPAAQGANAVTRIAWVAADALTAARDLSRTTVIGNIANATQGRTVNETFQILAPPVPGTATPAIVTIPVAVERTGPLPLLSPGVCGTPPAIRLYTLANAPLAWLPQPSLDPTGEPVPEIQMTQMQPATLTPSWTWVRTLLNSSAFEQNFTIDPASYRAIGTNSNGSLQSEYDGDGGDTIRFGDGVFGANPDPGMEFNVTYRYGAGASGNVAADAVTQLDPSVAALGLFTAVTNPLAPLPPAFGSDAQTVQSIKRLAPQQFRATQLRAVVANDYATAAETTQSWVKRAGTVFRWTGSWLTTFTTPEPIASEQIPLDDRLSLIQLLNRYRMAGTESYVPDPIYVSIDLIIELCAMANAFAAQVQQAVTAALSPIGPGAADAFFAVSRFVFGQPLQRSALEAAIQAVPGVAGVTCIEYRKRNLTAGFTEMGDVVTVGSNQILRCDNDPSLPNHGALAVAVQGGR